LSLALPTDPLRDAGITLVLGTYALMVLFATKFIYNGLSVRVGRESALYYTRKVVHILAGGVITILVPVLYSSPVFPCLAAFGLGAFLYGVKRRGGLLYWFQTRDNSYEINFTIAWGLSVFILWYLLDNPFLAILPAAFIAFGDAVTGIVRNSLFKERNKHWSGNLAMALTVVPLGFFLGGVIGAIAGVVASLVERFEFRMIDDNLIIVIASSIILLFPMVLAS